MNNYIPFLKELIKFKLRLFKSVYWFIQVYFFSRRFVSSNKYKDIFIICPGPSLKKFKVRSFSDSSLIIFINHAVKISNEFNCDKLLFTADTTRANELLSYQINFQKIIAIGHFFQMNSNILNGFNFLVPKVKLDLNYGLVGKRCKIIVEKNIGKDCGIGFGSLLNAINFATRFNPSTINLVGCDFGQKSSEKYAFEFKGINSHTPFDEIFKQFLLIEEILRKMKIRINRI